MVMHIYFGSQSGTAEAFAAELSEDAQKRGFPAQVIDLEDFNALEFAQQTLVILIVATYGEGDPTENAVAFAEWLEEGDGGKSLQGVRFAVMGLGDRNYANFNAMGQRVDAGMERLGATRVHARGIGDDSGDIGRDFSEWCSGLWDALGPAEPPLQKRRRMEQKDGKVEERPEDVTEAEAAPAGPAPESNACGAEGEPAAKPATAVHAGLLKRWQAAAGRATVARCRTLVDTGLQGLGRIVKHIELDVSALEPGWQAGDTIELLPCSEPADVDWFARRLRIPEHEGAACKVKAELAECDLVGLPPAHVIEALAQHLSHEPERAALFELLRDPRLLQQLAGHPVRLSFQELWCLFLTSLDMESADFLAICPRLLPRPYTAASSPLEDPNVLAVACSLVRRELEPLAQGALGLLGERGLLKHRLREDLDQLCTQRRQLRGPCSSMLCLRCGPGDHVRARTRPSVLRLPPPAAPSQPPAPLVMVAAGTGIAPFRAYLRERLCSPERRRGAAVLFFGCRRREEDFLYRDELQEALESRPPALSRLELACSREPEGGAYVQQRLREHAALLRELDGQGARFVLCGGPGMVRGAGEALEEALGTPSSSLRAEGRLVEEIWG